MKRMAVSILLGAMACHRRDDAAPQFTAVASSASPTPSEIAAAPSASASDPAVSSAEIRELIGLLNEAAGDGGPQTLPTAPWGRGDDPFAEHGNMFGASPGDGGLGGMGEGIGLGNIGTIGHGGGTGGSGSLGGAHRTPGTPSIRQGATTVNGRLPPEVIQRIVRHSFGRFRLCYERGLLRDPKLAGSVTTKFVIDTQGAVSSSARDVSTTLPDAAVVSCVVAAFSNLSFPQPEGGVVTVVYPLAFAPP